MQTVPLMATPVTIVQQRHQTEMRTEIQLSS